MKRSWSLLWLKKKKEDILETVFSDTSEMSQQLYSSAEPPLQLQEVAVVFRHGVLEDTLIGFW